MWKRQFVSECIQCDLFLLLLTLTYKKSKSWARYRRFVLRLQFRSDDKWLAGSDSNVKAKKSEKQGGYR